MAKRASASSSSGQPSQPKRTRFAPADQPWNGSNRNLELGSCLTEEDAQRVCGEEPEPAKSHPAEYCQSCTGNSLKDIVQQMHSVENSLQKLKELVQLSVIHSPHLGRVDARSTGINDVRNLRLQFRTKLSDPLFTGRKLRGVGGARISVALIDATTGDVITSGPESSLKLDVVVLEGDFNKDDEDDWAHEEFENFMVKERQQKGLLLTGDLQVTLNGGVGELGELTFTDNSSWNRSKRFRIGLKKASGYCGNTRIREAKTDAFRVKEHRGESSKKHDIPAFEDEIWRLKMIAKDGKYHRKLNEVRIHKVGDFLLQLFTDPMKLKEILGMSPNSTNWDTLENHAKSCKINWKLYLYYTDGTRKHGAVFNTDHQLIGLIKDRVYCASDGLSADDLEHGDTIVKKALGNKNDVLEFNGETFSPSMQKESSSSIPCKEIEGQIENLTPVQSNLAPRVWAAAGGSEAPPANVGLTAEEHDGATALALLGRLQNINSGNAMKLSIDESVHPAAQKPISTDPMNVLIPQGDSHSSRQMDHTVNENGPPSKPPPAPISRFQSSTLLLKPGKLIRLEGKNIWLDFRYECLSHYRYSCGILGHYAMYCKDISFDDVKMEGKDKLCFGQWLRVEVREHSPFWQAFYETQPKQDKVEETVPETLQPSTLLLPVVPHSTNQHPALMEVSTEQHVDYHTTIVQSSTPLVDHSEGNVAQKLKSLAMELLEVIRDSVADSSKSKKLKSTRMHTKVNPLKKAKRYTPYGSRSYEHEGLDENHLMDTPIFKAEGVGSWAMVACPKKPPTNK